MKKNIKQASELPTWFKLEKYNFTKNLKAFGWYEQLTIRTLFICEIQQSFKNRRSFPEGLKQAIQTVRENPNSDMLRDNRLAEYYTPKTNFLDLLNPKTNTDNMRGILSITIRDYMCMKYFLDEEKFAYMEKWIAAEKEGDVADAPWMDEPLYNFYINEIGTITDVIWINLASPDSFIIESFKKYLEDRRKKQKPKNFTPKHFRESDFNNWSRWGLLPFLDLTILESELLENIPYRVLADAIFPTGEGNEETIRKTTKPLAIEVIDCRILHQLSAQAAHDIKDTEKS